MKEEWKTIPGIPAYMASSLGRIRSMRNNKILNPWVERNGYQRVNCRGNGASKKFSVHRLIGLAFIDNINGCPQINHKNGIRIDNRVENLEWCTGAYNIQKSKGTKLNKLMVIEIRESYSKNPEQSIQKMADKYKVAWTTIYDVIKLNNWKDIHDGKEK